MCYPQVKTWKSECKCFHSLWWFGVQCHLLVLVHCVFWKPMSLHPFTKKFWSTSCFLLLTSFLKMLHFQAGFGTCPHCQKHQKLVKWPWCWCAWLASKLTRPEPHRESMGYCQEENEKQETKKCRWSEYWKILKLFGHFWWPNANGLIRFNVLC